MIVCYTGGGTLGHVYPALAVHEVLSRDAGYQALWIGRHNEEEQRVVEEQGIPFHAIRSGKLRRYASLQNFFDIGNLIIAFFQAWILLRRYNIDVLFSKGGFVSVPPVWAAKLLGIPIISHESDASPGLATRLNARFSTFICVPFSQGYERLGKKKVMVTGNPIRESLVLQAQTDLPPLSFLSGDEKLVLVLGGSSGSQQINNLVYESLPELTRHAYVYHQCGPHQATDLEHPRYQQVEFITRELGQLLKRADLVVSRSGAGTLAELSLFGCASLLIPLSGETSRGDQVENADRLAQMHAARILCGDVDSVLFTKQVISLLEDTEERKSLGNAMKALSDGQGAQRIAALVRTMKE